MERHEPSTRALDLPGQRLRGEGRSGEPRLHAVDKATGKEQKIIIQASSGLSEDEIEQMVKDAEAHASEDKAKRELVDMRNQADQLAYQTEKQLEAVLETLFESEAP